MKFTNKEILDEIVKIENHVNLSVFVIDGVNYWPAVRIRIAFGIIEQRYGKKRSSLASRLDQFIRIFNKIKRLSLVQDRIDVLLVSHPNYKVQVGSNRHDRVLEGHKIDLRATGQQIAELDLDTWDIIFDDDGKRHGNIYLPMLMTKVLAYVYSKWAVNRFRKLDIPISDINARLGQNLEGYQIKFGSLVTYLSYLYGMQIYFRRFLSKRGVRDIYQCIYYDPVGLALNVASSDIGVSKYCVQHGGQSMHHPAFGRWSNVPTSGYEMLPDTFLCWDQISAKTILEWSSQTDRHKVRVDGYRWAELWRKNEFAYENTQVIKQLAAGKFNILYTLQPSVGALPDMMNNLISDLSLDARWWLRLHPRQLGSELHKNLVRKYNGRNDSVIVDIASDEPLPAVMAQMNLHITSFSSSVYEAHLFNVKTILIDKSGFDYFVELIEQGKAELILDREPLKKKILQMISNTLDRVN